MKAPLELFPLQVKALPTPTPSSRLWVAPVLKGRMTQKQLRQIA
jgi:hypothetical protein